MYTFNVFAFIGLLLIPVQTFGAVPYSSYSSYTPSFSYHYSIHGDRITDAIVLGCSAVILALVTGVEVYNAVDTVLLVNKDDSSVLERQKVMLQKIVAKIQARIQRARAWGYNLLLTPAEEHDMAWAYNEQLEMLAYDNDLNPLYVEQLRKNFKIKAVGHAGTATLFGLLATLCGYISYQELNK